MRIIYGCNSQGQGHLSKAAVLVPLLSERGHEVRVISSGPSPPAIYRFPWHCHLPGLPYTLVDGRTDPLQTVLNWGMRFPELRHALVRLQKIVREFQPELILSDFEPLTASPLLRPRCEVVSMCRQVALLDPEIPIPEGDGFQRKIARTMIRAFILGADRLLGFHYLPASHRCLPPVIRQELLSVPVSEGKHLFVYNYHDAGAGEVEKLLHWSRKRGIPVRAYGFHHRIERGLHGEVLMQPDDRMQMIRDLASCRAAIVTCGFTTPVEAILLKKPVANVPLQEQWEQLTNAWHLEQAGLARTFSDWDYDRALELSPPATNHPATQWLKTSPDCILDAVLLEEHSRREPEPVGQAA